jgi:hypothetical protein
MVSRASDFTALVALNFFFFFLPGILLPGGLRARYPSVAEAVLTTTTRCSSITLLVIMQ